MHKINLDKKTLDIVEDKNKDCINCKKCFSVCPMMKEYSASPRELMEKIIEDKAIDKDIPYSCMLCNICKVKCPKDIDLKDMFYNIRKDIFFNNPKELKNMGYNTVKFHQVNSFSSLFSRDFTDNKTKKIFLPGCSLSSYSSEIVINTFEYLKSHIDDISLTIECCGKPTLAMGDTEKFKKYYTKLDKIFNKNDIYEVIVACPNCFDTIRKNSNNIKVTPLWSVIKEYGLPEGIQNNYLDVKAEFSLHDPCPVRYEPEIHEDVRDILKLLGVKIVEFDKNRENSECCGSGGMVRVTNNQISLSQTNKRAREAKTDTVISYCESCCESMMLANKSTLHILDFIFNEEVINKNTFTQNNTSVIDKWKMRYKTIKLAKNIKL
ncbi:(Fe-S)-binding protein [Romboutsia weinsteinii]|uniref:(Fe-S)-binding protein n=1 Tax=Romboutsia weinsteinii TaxID=2020949 RepID=A0A371J114_9FIRM|nr:(Fe-S)-binding protein [Romboutsia weinsteinii]RDY26346.1 (Fe-S)-binding protein [Romboutsia weinsteinii]